MNSEKKKQKKKKSPKNRVAIKTREALPEIQTKDMELHQVANDDEEMLVASGWETEFGCTPVVLEPFVKTTESNRSGSCECDRD